MRNKKIIVLALILLVMPMVLAADYSYLFQQDKETNLKIFCVDDNNVLCDATVGCNLTILYPNNSILIDNEIMTHNANYFNYSLTTEQMNTIGEYSVSVACANSYAGFSTFTYLITPSGEPFTPEKSYLLFGILLSIFLFICLLFYISSKMAESRDLPLTIFFSVLGYIFIIWFFHICGVAVREYIHAEWLISTFSQWVIIFEVLFLGIIVYIIVHLIASIAESVKNEREDKLL